MGGALTLNSHRHKSAEPWKSLKYIRTAANALQDAGKIAIHCLLEEQASAESKHHGIRSCTHHSLFDHEFSTNLKSTS